MQTSKPTPQVVIDFPGSDGKVARRAFSSPVQIVSATRLEDVRPALDTVAAGVRTGLVGAGFVAYEAAPGFDPALVVRPGGRLPLVWFGLFAGSGEAGVEEPAARFDLGAWRPDVTPAEYEARVRSVREAIAAGETYQVNLTFRLRTSFSGSAWGLYETLRRAHEPCYCAFFDLGSTQILSLSPELFFHWTGEGLTTRPMKGTRPRGRFLEEDQRLAAELLGSEKERAENLMIVDLLRNDLGRIAEVGTVEVPSLFALERYPTVWQMTSTVTARARPGLSLGEVFAALFPCGSVTGAPKVATTRMIASLEDSPREVYCGAIGLVTPDEGAIFNVAIRTLVIDTLRGQATYGVGGGVTWDSTAAGEYAEALTKAAALERPRPSFRLLETMRLEDGVLVRSRRHVQRLKDSAQYFGFADPADAVDRALDACVLEHPAGQWKVRALVDVAGQVEVECTSLDPIPEPPVSVALANQSVDSHDCFLFHKTTHREVYDRRRASRPECFDVLLVNERGELTELTIGNLVLALDSALWTPPRECGLLAGVLRGELLEQGVLHERVLLPGDLPRATALWLINSVREWVPIRIVE